MTFLSLFGGQPVRDSRVSLFVHDNSPAPMHDPGEWASAGFRIRYLSDTSNPGVSCAYNRGARLAKELGERYVLFLDDETIFPENALSLYLSTIEAHSDLALLAPILTSGRKIYSPCRHILHASFPLRTVTPGELPVKRMSVLGSGMCVRLNAFEMLGGFDERIGLDFADHDFVRRYKQRFDRIFVIDLACRHGFSGGERTAPDAALVRFGFYCKGAKNSARGLFDVFLLLLLVLIRAVRLSVSYRSTSFLLTFFRVFLKN